MYDGLFAWLILATQPVTMISAFYGWIFITAKNTHPIRSYTGYPG
jgi:hypothetical protein